MTFNGNQRATSTDMYVNILANTEKMVETDRRWVYEKENLDDNVENYVEPGQKQTAPIFQKQEPETKTRTEQPNYRNETEANEPVLSREEELLLKLDLLRRLGELKQSGVSLSQNYSMESDIKMMQYELKLHTDIKSKQNAVQWMKHMLIGCLKGLEILNDTYNPFDIKLNGLSDKISADINSYHMVLGEIYEKYNQPGKQMAPEMKLLLMLSGAVLSLQASRILPTMMPRMATALRSDTAVLNELRTKAAESAKLEKQQQEQTSNEHVEASKKMSDLQMIKESELQYQRMKRVLDTKNSADGLILSSDSPPAYEQPKYRENMEDRNAKAIIENENKKLDKIMEKLDSDSVSTRSTISVNPKLRDIMGRKNNESEIGSKDISFGSKDSSKKDKKNSNAFGLISVGSKNKGERMIISVGSTPLR